MANQYEYILAQHANYIKNVMIISQEKLFPLMEVIKPKLQNGHATLGSEMKIHGYQNNGALDILFFSLVFFYSTIKPQKLFPTLSALSLLKQKRSSNLTFSSSFRHLKNVALFHLSK